MTAAGWERGVLFSRLTTIGTGGPATRLARPGTIRELEEAVRVAAAEGLPLVSVGLGSNVLAADAGVEGVVLQLEGELAAVEIHGELVVAGGGAANAVCLHAARNAGLGGFEFACAIPGTVGGGVAMNAGAFGGDFAGIVERALVVTQAGADWLDAHALMFGYRTSAIRPNHVVAQVEFRLAPRPPTEIRAAVRDLVEQRKRAQPTNRRTFGSVFRNPPEGAGAGRLIDECALKGHRVGGALISPVHANFIENAGGATSADCLALMREAQHRVHERFGLMLEPEVRLLGGLALA